MTTAIILANLGTPDAPTTAAVRQYLAEFLGDPRVVEQPRWLWWPILHGVILRIRPARSAKLYRTVWTERGSPLASGTADLAAAVQQTLGDGVIVRDAMRYRNPGIANVLNELAGHDLRRVLVVPLFPQYSATTTASVFDAVSKTLQSWRRLPDLRFVQDYHDEPAYVEALARSVEEHWLNRGRADRLLLSFHGIPQRYVDNGDPYQDQCLLTAAALRQRLGLPPEELIVSFQSRVGREPWLQPYTDETLQQLANGGVKSVQVLCPGFSIDCLETLEEVAITNRELFVEAGGERYEYIPCLNDRYDHVQFLADLIRRNLGGWNVSLNPDHG